jgi:hypothetical protein
MMNFRDYRDAASATVSDAYDTVSDAVSNIDPDIALAKGLGWASLAIGAAELAAPRKVEELLGIDHTPEARGTIRAMGVRELCHGLAILSEDGLTKQLKTSVWSRVAGDMLDSVLLAKAGTKTKKPASFAAVTASVLAIGVLDMICAKRLSDRYD